MLPFIIKRVGWMLLTLWVVFTVSFFLMRAAPGGPYSRERQLDPQVEANLKARYNLDAPLYKQYLTSLWNMCRGDFGCSFTRSDFTVNDIIRQGMPISATLGFLAMSFAVFLGITAGIVSATHRNSPSDFILMSLATIGIALPDFVLAGLIIILFVFIIPLFPVASWGTPIHLVLPAFCLGAPYAAYIARLTRTGMLDVLSQDYIRTAKSKGLSQTTVIFKHALRGAIMPVVSFLGPAIAGIITGSLVIEQIFFIPGLGAHFIEAAIQRDYTLAMGMVMLFTFLLYLMNLIVDIAYALIDPRVKLE
ncbi:MAG: ABC transporter permease [Thermoguttaceae bacterium]|jgi:oligopeptide transport system permease protein|nr:ABC transporter permease [Thermoguttaceae bacterium]MBQ6615139.1 ABC transporter permease [Thermoguttaceae bacterium]